MTGAGEFLEEWARQIKQGVDVSFANFQMALPERPSDGGEVEDDDEEAEDQEHVTMHVNGGEADVVRSPLSDAAQRLIDDARPSSNGTTWADELGDGIDGKVAQMQRMAETAHPFERHDADNQCAACRQGEEAAIHHATQEATEARENLAARSRGGRR